MSTTIKKIKKKLPFKKRRLLLQHIIHTDNPGANAPFEYPKNEVSSTKYNALTFIPLFLYQQFRKLPYLYFLVVCILTCIPQVSPVSPVSTILPFLLIIITAAVKEAWEDLKRWRSDKEINKRRYEVLRSGELLTIKNEEIVVGDILLLRENQEVPADVVLFTSSGKEGICYVDTANLDGETNLKLFKSHPATASITKEDMKNLTAIIKSQPPSEKLYEFSASMIFKISGEKLTEEMFDETDDEDILILGKSQLLMKGVRIRNTSEAWSIVVFTGKDTKLSLNSIAPPSKFASTDKTLNYITIFLFAFTMILTIIATIISAVRESETTMWYNPVFDGYSLDAGIVFMAYFILLGYTIPVSLFVNIEILKAAQATWMETDEELVLEVQNPLAEGGVDKRSVKVRNSNLNDDLSKISYIFSDKTGTLTQNKMIFDQCCVGSLQFPTAGKGELKPLIGTDENVRNFLLNMALNNEVLPEEKDKRSMPKYAAPSPDEIALVKGAYVNGVQFRNRSNAGIEIQFESEDPLVFSTEIFNILYTFEFTSQRKRSSVIAKVNDKYVMFSKGADSVMKRRLRGMDKVSDTSESVGLSPLVPSSAGICNIPMLEEQLSRYTRVGLRTLVYAKKELSDAEMREFSKRYAAAANDLTNRESELQNLMDEMENDFELQGCTAILDALQEEVPHTIDYLVKAGIKVWMITGDQQDTAENIGFSCNLVNKSSKIVRVVKCDGDDRTKAALENAKEVLEREIELLDKAKAAGKPVPEYPHVSLVIDGQSLVFALSEALSPLLLEVGKQCETVICCRADPLQKALVVRLIKKGTRLTCLSIGDGANDVSMIQEAHVGVGIWGEEGSQAANNSDYAISRFKHLTKLLTVHGRQSMIRTAALIEFSFYKNIAIFTIQFYFGIYCMFSAQSFFDDWFMAFYNVVIVSLTPLAMAFFEKDLTEDIILKYPHVYRELKQGLYFTAFTIGKTFLSALIHSVIIFFFTIYAISGTITYDGINENFILVSNICACAAVFAILNRGALVTKHWVWPAHAAYWLSILFLFALLLVESSIIAIFPSFYNVEQQSCSLAYYWFIILLVTVVCVFIDGTFEYIQRQYFPKVWQIVQEYERDTNHSSPIPGYKKQVNEEDDPSYFSLDNL